MRITEQELWGSRRGNVYCKLLIYEMWRHMESSLKEMDYSAVSASARRFEEEMKTNKTSRQLVERLDKEVMKRSLKECGGSANILYQYLPLMHFSRGGKDV
jgi:hypothetical protein